MVEVSREDARTLKLNIAYRLFHVVNGLFHLSNSSLEREEVVAIENLPNGILADHEDVIKVGPNNYMKVYSIDE